MRRASPLFVTALLASACASAPPPSQPADSPTVAVASDPAPAQETPPAEDQAPPAKTPDPPVAFDLPSTNDAGPARVEPGKVYLIHVWATFCAPCKRSLPALQTLATRYAQAGLRVIAVSVDEAGNEASVLTFVKTLGITYPVTVDPDGKIANVLQPPTLPSTIVIDRTGKIHTRTAGFTEGDETKLEELIKPLLTSSTPK